MTREEAIEVYNGLINTKIKEAFEFFAPELAESEDERNANALIRLLNDEKVSLLMTYEARQQWLNWLERKKTPSVSFEPAVSFDSGSAIVYHNDESEDAMMEKAIVDALLSHCNSINLLSLRGYQIEDVKAWLEKQRAKERLDRMAPIYNDKESFESALEKAWKYYNESASRTVDSFEDDYIECVFSKGFREGFLYKEKQEEQRLTLKFKVGDKIHLIDGTSPNYEDDCITIREIGTVNYLGEFKEGYVPIKEQDKWELVKEQKPAESISRLTVQGKGVYKICPHCKSRMMRNDSVVYTSIPPQYEYNCPKCGTLEFDTVMYDNPEMEEQKPEWNKATINGEPISSENKAVDIPCTEWSEEDEDFINMLILHFNYLIDKGGDSVETYKSYIEKLKSLRPCPSWKPSEEQMKALQNGVALTACDKELSKLYNQLKKLM